MKMFHKQISLALFFVLFHNNLFNHNNNSSIAYNCSNLSYENHIKANLYSLNLKNYSKELNRTSNSCWFMEQETLNGSLFYSTIYGDFIVDDPLIIELINSQEMQRLKHINQYGIDFFVYKAEQYTRFQHSICVYLLAKKYGASLEEQVAALLHDVSHTIFSHSGDFLLKEDCRGDSYQDDIYDLFLHNSSIKQILEKYHLSIKDVSHKKMEFKILDQAIPELCADRIEYNLYGGYLEEIIAPVQVKAILNDLKYENGLWYFSNISSGLAIAYIALFLTDTRFAGFDNFARNGMFSKILECALEKNIITIDDIHSSTDDIIWNRLINCNDSVINAKILQLINISDSYEINCQEYDVCYYPKFRAINPFIKTDVGFFRLTELHEAFKTDFEALKARINAGIFIKFNK